ncbi:MAG: AraC family transcriptional regulator [Bacteroidota bacterium]
MSVWAGDSGKKLHEMMRPDLLPHEAPEMMQDFQIHLPEVAGLYREYIVDGMTLGYGNFRHGDPIHLQFESGLETVEMHFKLDGQSRTKDNGSHVFCDFDSNQHNVVYAPGFRGTSDVYSERNTEFFEINMAPETFLRLLPKEGRHFQDFRERIMRKQGGTLLGRNPNIGPHAQMLIRDLVHCNRTGIFKKMFVESRVTELLMLQFEEAVQADQAQDSRISAQTLEKMHAIREFLLNSPDSRFTLSDLARKVGTNVFTLKQSFKQAFGTTVFGYWNGVKMEHARRLLLDNRLPIKIVAEKVGYKHPQHFSTAFKKHFGFSPSTLLA